MKDKRILVPFEIKALTEDGLFTGYASVFGNKDLDGDVVVKGAFKRTIANSKGKVPILWQHDYRQPVGANRTAEEDDNGLKVEGKIFTEMPNGKNAYEWVKNAKEEGLPVGLSIGYRVIDHKTENGVRYLKELALGEYSIVTFPANEEAGVTSVKAAVGYQDLPLAPDTRRWSASAATKRVYAWAGGDDINWEKYRKAFLIYDADAPEKKGSYKLPIADIISGKLTAVPAGISAAAGRLDQTDATAVDKAGAKAHLEKYYRKMNKPSPFDKSIDYSDGSILKKAVDFAEALQQEMDERELCELRWTIQSALCDALESVCDDESMTIDDKLSMIETIYTQYGTAMVSWYAKYLAVTDDSEDNDETADVPAATGASADESKARSLTNLHKRVLKAAHALHLKAIMMHDEAGKLHSQGAAMVDSVVKGYAEAFDPDERPINTDKSTQLPSPDLDEVKALDSLWKRMIA